MSRSCTLGFLLLVLGVGQIWAHERIVLDDRRSTPGLRLEMHELPQTASAPEARYRLEAFGFPSGTRLLLLTREFDHSSRQLASGLRVDRSGRVMVSSSGGKGRPIPLDEMSFGPGPYARGALWEVGLVSVDGKLQALAKTRPYPIHARAGECKVSLELMSHRGDKFLATGSGFVPGEEVTTESRYADRVIQKRTLVSSEGLLRPQMLLHAAMGSDRNARYLIKGRSCEVSLDYLWGEPALVRR
jgi:hypothetical protein